MSSPEYGGERFHPILIWQGATSWSLPLFAVIHIYGIVCSPKCRGVISSDDHIMLFVILDP